MSHTARVQHTTRGCAGLIALALLCLPWAAAAQTTGGEAPPPPPTEAAPAPAAEMPPPPPTEAAPPPAAAEPTPPPPPMEAAPEEPLGPDPMSVRVLEDQLRLGVGGEFFVLKVGDDYIGGNGPAFMLAAHWMRWWGPFMLGGGTSVYYSYMIETRDPPDTISQLTINGEAMIGGGIYGVFAVYLHLVLGGGVAFAYDAGTDANFILPWLRAVAGVGAHVNVLPQLSVGVLVDIGWPGTIQGLATLAWHYG